MLPLKSIRPVNENLQELIAVCRKLPKMSEFEKNKNLARGKNGFINCQLCPRRFVSLIGFENHSNLGHSDVALKHLEIQKVKIGIPNHVFDESITKQNDYESLEESSHLHISVLEKEKPCTAYN